MIMELQELTLKLGFLNYGYTHSELQLSVCILKLGDYPFLERNFNIQQNTI